jgi:putative ATPase
MSDSERYRPLADRMRPQNIDDFFGQGHLLGNDNNLRKAISSGILHSMVFWGPPGSGKTTLAQIIATTSNANLIRLSAVLSGVKEIRQAIEQASRNKQDFKQDTVLFVDEVHRFNKAQQDAFLPHIENGTIYFIGATTENPSFELNNALLSRLRIYVLKSLDIQNVKSILNLAIKDNENGIGRLNLSISEDALDVLADLSDGDARRALNLLEIISDFRQQGQLEKQDVINVFSSNDSKRFDKNGDIFYDQISALHKSVRGSSPDAALYWFVRMLDGGCDPVYIARRVVRMATEDIGNADPRALRIALDAWETQDRLGSPEGELAIAQAIIYLACAAKSNAVYRAFNEAKLDVSNQTTLEVPMHLRNAPTGLMKELGHGDNYRYAHDEPEGYVAGENYFPDGMSHRQYYRPVNRGLEQTISEKLERLRQLDNAEK